MRTLAPEQSDLTPAEPEAELSGLTVPLSALIAETVGALVKELGLSGICPLSRNWRCAGRRER